MEKREEMNGPAETKDAQVFVQVVDFSKALRMLKAGLRVQRRGWNGKGMYVTLQEGYPRGVPINANTAKATGLSVGTVARFRRYLMMKTVDDEFVPWVASQTDILADDWSVLEE